MSPDEPPSEDPAKARKTSTEDAQAHDEAPSEDERKARGGALGGILTGEERQAIVRAPPVDESISPPKRIYRGEAAEAERERRETAENRTRRRAIRKLRRALEDVAWALPWLTQDEKRELVDLAGGSQTTALERIMVEVSAAVGWEALPPEVRNGRGTVAEGLAAALQGGLRNYLDEAKRRNVSVEIRLLPDADSADHSGSGDDPEQPFRPVRVVAEDVAMAARTAAQEQRGRVAHGSADSEDLGSADEGH